MADRTPRKTTTREDESRRKPWAPPSHLQAPDAPPGYVHRWIRVAMRGEEDKMNVNTKLREGWEPVRGEEHPDFEAPTVDEGRHAGVIGVGGLILAKMPIETVEQRRAYYNQMASDQMEAVDSNLMRESDGRMPISEPNRRTQVTFGKGGDS